METLLIALPVLIFSIVVHEFAHGWVARTQGDNTAAMLGRLTLNPIPHLDPMGSVLVPGLLAAVGAPILGWAKPVPVNPRNFRNYKRGDILVSLAGVASNLALAIICTLLLAVAIRTLGPGSVVVMMLRYGILINFLLMVFNLLPIPPLDGSHVLYHFLPPALGARYRELGQYGMIILFALLYFTNFSFLRIPVGLLTSIAFGAAGV
jgi:Zn-dependent protease